MCSTDDYITFKKAEELVLVAKKVVITIEGVGGVKTTLTTKSLDVPVCLEKKRKGKSKYIMFHCYGMENIADATTPPEETTYSCVPSLICGWRIWAGQMKLTYLSYLSL